MNLRKSITSFAPSTSEPRSLSLISKTRRQRPADARGAKHQNLVLLTDGRVSPSTAAGLRQLGITMYTEALGSGAH